MWQILMLCWPEILDQGLWNIFVVITLNDNFSVPPVVFI